MCKWQMCMVQVVHVPQMHRWPICDRVRALQMQRWEIQKWPTCLQVVNTKQRHKSTIRRWFTTVQMVHGTKHGENNGKLIGNGTIKTHHLIINWIKLQPYHTQESQTHKLSIWGQVAEVAVALLATGIQMRRSTTGKRPIVVRVRMQWMCKLQIIMWWSIEESSLEKMFTPS